MSAAGFMNDIPAPGGTDNERDAAGRAAVRSLVERVVERVQAMTPALQLEAARLLAILKQEAGMS